MIGRLGSARVDQLQESPDNPRTSFDARALEELADSIREHGVLVPLLVRHASDNGHLVIVDGARRYRAAQSAGLEAVPVVIQDEEATSIEEIALVANLQRADVHPMDEARAFGRLVGVDRDLRQVAALAERLGKTKAYVWDRLKLLDLVPDAQRALHANRITLPHATVLARLLPAQQERVIDPRAGGLFTRETMLSWADEDGDDNELPDGTLRDPWIGLKAVSVRELESWIAKHVRFDPHVAAFAAPLDFGAVAEQVDDAARAPGRGKKVVSITYDTYVSPEAKGEERTYCRASWKRADGLDEDAPTCDRSVLGVVVTGSGYGKAFQVCVHKDCDVHWAEERKERERFAKQREQGESPAAGQARRDNEAQKRQEQWAREDQERKAWAKASPALAKATAAAIAKQKPMTLVADLLKREHGTAKDAEKLLGVPKTSDDVVRLLALCDYLDFLGDAWSGPREFPNMAKKIGLDVASILKAEAEPKAPPAKGKTTKADKTTSRKSTKKR